MTKPLVICLTPVKNEAWILDRFLKCASLWADHIIIADQGSDDGSREIALRYPKVILIENDSLVFNEPERQKLLISAARCIKGQKILIALDADEMLSANFMSSLEWETVAQSAPGTIITFNWVNIRDDFTYWTCNADRPFGFCDDGSEHSGPLIHSPRIPMPVHASFLKLKDIKVLHYQYSDWERMKSKHRWYQCWERINHPERRPIDIFRQYHHMYAVPKKEIQSVPLHWLHDYEAEGIDMTNIGQNSWYRWDKDVLELFAEHGVEKFSKEAIWDVDWNAIKEKVGLDIQLSSIDDPRNWIDRLIHKWLLKSQPYSQSRLIRIVDSKVQLFGW